MIPTEFNFIVSLYNHYFRMVYSRAPVTLYELPNDKTKQMACALSEDSD